jgi:hypothetical protein
MTVGVREESRDDYQIWSLDQEMGLIHFNVHKSTWTTQELHDMAETMKAFAMDADKALLDRIDQ